MQPVLLQTSSTDQREEYIKKYQQIHNLSDISTTHVEPEKKQIRIDQIRMIKKLLIHTLTQPQLVVVHQFDTAPTEAQNAFLKTLEEHNQLFHILLLVENIHTILPTVVSRCRTVHLQHKYQPEKKDDEALVEQALNTLIQNHSLGVLGTKALQVKTRQEAEQICDFVISYLRKRLATEGNRVSGLLRNTLLYRSYISRNNTNPQLCIDKLMIEIQKAHQPQSSLLFRQKT